MPQMFTEGEPQRKQLFTDHDPSKADRDRLS